MKVEVGAQILHEGHMQAIVHTGHIFDDDGNFIGYKEVVAKTDLDQGRNMITDLGFDFILGRKSPPSGDIRIGLDGVNSDFLPSDTVNGTALGYSESLYSVVSVTLVASNTDPLAGPLFRTIEHRRSFGPGAFGASPVNLARASLISADNSSQAKLRAGWLLVGARFKDAGGLPVTITLQPSEYLDIVWTHKETFPHDQTGSFTLVVDGVPQTIDYVVRPINMFANSFAASWGSLYGLNYMFAPDITQASRSALHASPSYYPTTVLNTYSGGLSSPSAVPSEYSGAISTGTGCASAVTADALVNGSKARSFTIAWAPTIGNVTGGAKHLIAGFNNGGGVWMFEFTPNIPKVAGKQLTLGFRIAMANAP